MRGYGVLSDPAVPLQSGLGIVFGWCSGDEKPIPKILPCNVCCRWVTLWLWDGGRWGRANASPSFGLREGAQGLFTALPAAG